jgi:hypothetical protein
MNRANLTRRLETLERSRMTDSPEGELIRRKLEAKLLGPSPIGQTFTPPTPEELAAMPPLHRKLLAPME